MAASEVQNVRTVWSTRLLKAARARWGNAGLVGRVWHALRVGGPRLVFAKARSFLSMTLPGGMPAPASTSQHASHSSQPLPAPDPSTIRLAADRSLDHQAWDEFLGPLLMRRLVMPSRTIVAPSTALPKVWIALFSDSDFVNMDDVRVSFDSIARLDAASEQDISAAIIFKREKKDVGGGGAPARRANGLDEIRRGIFGKAPSHVSIGTLELDNVLQRADPEDLIFFARLGDEIRPEMSLALKVFELNNKALCLFDLYFFENERVYPLLLPGLNEIMAMNCDFFRSRFMAKAAVVQAVRQSADGELTPYEIATEILSQRLHRGRTNAVHVAIPLVRINDSCAALREDQERLARAAAPFRYAAKSVRDGGFSLPREGVSIVICTKDKGHLVRQLVRHILKDKGDLIRDIVIVSNQTSNAYALATLSDLEKHPKIRIVTYPEPFNFSKQCNLGVEEAGGEYLLFLNDDISPVSDDWLEQLLAPFALPDAGITGPLLLYPDERVQHAGMFLGYAGVAGHTMRFARLPQDDYLFTCISPREVYTLTGAAMMMPRQLFEDMNGFDPLLATYIQDVDLCLRVAHSGRRLIYNPRSILLHMESTSIAETLDNPLFMEKRSAEHGFFMRRWGALLDKDPFHNPSFSRTDESLRALTRIA